jgi:hypothetical protein
MANLAGYGELLGVINGLYWVVAALVTWWAWRKPATQSTKVAAAAFVATLFLILPVSRIYSVGSYKWQYNTAKALFDERCKTAGEKIYRTVENVEGIQLINPRSSSNEQNRADNKWIDAGLPAEHGGASYILSFLYWEHVQASQSSNDPERASRSYLNDKASPLPGYKFVDIKLPDGRIERATLVKGLELQRLALTTSPAQYVVTQHDISTPEDRERWIAGTKVQIKKESSNELIAEKTWYAFEPGFGNTSGGRSPWGFAHVCPRSGHGASPTRYFVDQVLKPVKGE